MTNIPLNEVGKTPVLRIVLITHWLTERGGGVTTAVRAIARELSRRNGVELHVVGLVDGSEAISHEDWGRTTVQGLRSGIASGPLGYAPGMTGLLRRIAPDIVHVHGLWTYSSVAAERWRKRSGSGQVIVSPHGMLDEWAMRNSGWKKVIAGYMFQRRAIMNAAFVQALTQQEAEEVRNYVGPIPVAVVPNGVELPDDGEAAAFSVVPVLRKDERMLLYLGRIHPKKNLAFLLRSWAKVGQAKSGWRLVIVGWDQDNHSAELTQLSEKLGLADQVSICGPMFGRQKADAFRAATAFVLPSLSEGLPMVVLEAWSHARPVLMTDACNLADGFDQGAACHLRDNEVDAAVDLAAFLTTPAEKLEGMGKAGLEHVLNRYSWEKVTTELLELYYQVLNTDSPPCVLLESDVERK